MNESNSLQEQSANFYDQEVKKFVNAMRDDIDILQNESSSKEDLANALGSIIESFGVVMNSDEAQQPSAYSELSPYVATDISELENRLNELQQQEDYIQTLPASMPQKTQRLCNLLDVASSRLMMYPHPLAKIAGVACSVAKKFVPVRNIELENITLQQIDTYNALLAQQLEAIQNSHDELLGTITNTCQNIQTRHSDVACVLDNSLEEIKNSSDAINNQLMSELENF